MRISITAINGMYPKREKEEHLKIEKVPNVLETKFNFR